MPMMKWRNSQGFEISSYEPVAPVTVRVSVPHGTIGAAWAKIGKITKIEISASIYILRLPTGDTSLKGGFSLLPL